MYLGLSQLLFLLVIDVLTIVSGRECIGLLQLEGIDLRPIEEALTFACDTNKYCHYTKGCAEQIAVLGLGAAHRGLARQLGQVKETTHRRELRFVDSLENLIVERAKEKLDSMLSVIVLEDEAEEIAKKLMEHAFSSHFSWIDIVLQTQALNAEFLQEITQKEDLAVYIYGRSLALQDRARSSSECGSRSLMKENFYLWMHSYGYAPLEPIRGEGLNGWRIIFARVLTLAKQLHASIILPCARHSVLVPCGVRFPLTGKDIVGNSADDDYVEDSEKGIDSKMRDWLELFANNKDQEDDTSYDDDASRGLIGLRNELDDISAYFNIAKITQYLNGAIPLTVDCFSSDLNIDLRQFRAEDKHLYTQISKFFASNKNNTIQIAKLNGGFDLGSMRSIIPSITEVENGPLLGFAPRLHAEALAFRRLVFGDRPFTAVHWRSETLIARRDKLAPAAFQACADALLSFAANTTTPVLLISDIPYDENTPSWLSFDSKLKAAHPEMRELLRNFISIWPYYKYDAIIPHLAPGYKIDLGDLAIIEQILALEAPLLATHYDHPNATISTWNGVDFNDCGYSGRFIRTILSRRLHANRTIANWYPPNGFPHLRSPASTRGTASHQRRLSTAERLTRED